MMAWQDAAASALSVVLLICHAAYAAISASLAAAGQLGLFLLRLVSWPIAAFYNTLLFVLAPVIYTTRFVLAPFFYVFDRLPRLEPLYIYFGSAAFVGFTFGLILMLLSGSMSAVLGLYDRPDEEKARQQQYYGAGEEAGLHHHRRPTTPMSGSSEHDRLEALLANINISSPESDLGLGGSQGGGWRGGPNVKRKRRSAAASRLIGTILEEDDDSF